MALGLRLDHKLPLASHRLMLLLQHAHYLNALRENMSDSFQAIATGANLIEMFSQATGTVLRSVVLTMYPSHNSTTVPPGSLAI